MGEAILGVIGGTGLYEIEGLEDVERVELDTPFGKPSGAMVTGRLAGTRMAFLPRHGPGHLLIPSEVNYRANIHAFRQIGARHLLSISAVGSLAGDIHPGDMVVPDQVFDRTKGRPHTFFGQGIAAHVSFGDPFCPAMREALLEVLKELDVRTHARGTYVCMEGPCFSSRAESEFYRSIGAAVIGMTNLPEAKLAREAEICYATLALSTDYDCWHHSEESVSANAVKQVLAKNADTARAAVLGMASRFPPSGTCTCQQALDTAILTDPADIPAETRDRLRLLIGRFLSD
ncbi:MAG: S-methyl-5'-thioadenosine phosphorylase [Deltaproteobacteria bacterium]|nr:S-methyl-5'-thioadenosine phosphorylase [Deltaproteobacteria bacterium]